MRHFIRWVALVVVGLAALPVGGAAEALPRQEDEQWRCVEVNGQIELNVHDGPDLGASVVSVLQPGETFEADYPHVRNTDRFNWVPVRMDGTEGWVITARLAPCESAYAEEGHQVVLKDINDDGVLDRVEIAAVARSVVMLGNVQDERLVATGTGTIVTPDGLILTNAHVVSEADFVGVALLGDINDPAEYRYIGEVISYNEEFDVAVVAIRYDVDGYPVDVATLNLPYLPTVVPADQVFRGDPVTIFGFPGIADDYLVVTNGSIVSVENGDVDEERMPIWYRTDAEIAPGNSGGLVVDGNGHFLGIPTVVRSETATGGRLGGIRPAQVAVMAALGEQRAMVGGQPMPDPATVAVELLDTWAEYGAQRDGVPGMEIHVALKVNGWAGFSATLAARFYRDDADSKPLINGDAPGQYRDKSDKVLTSILIIPCCDETVYDDLVLFIPYDSFGLTPGTYRLKYQLEVVGAGDTWVVPLKWQYFVLRGE